MHVFLLPINKCSILLHSSVKDIIHERAWIKSDVFKVAVKIVCETRDKEMGLQLEKMLKDNYELLSWNLPAV